MTTKTSAFLDADTYNDDESYTYSKNTKKLHDSPFSATPSSIASSNKSHANAFSGAFAKNIFSSNKSSIHPSPAVASSKIASLNSKAAHKNDDSIF